MASTPVVTPDYIEKVLKEVQSIQITLDHVEQERRAIQAYIRDTMRSKADAEHRHLTRFRIRRQLNHLSERAVVYALVLSWVVLLSSLFTKIVGL